MKKAIPVLLMMVMLVGVVLAGCGDNSPSSSGKPSGQAERGDSSKDSNASKEPVEITVMLSGPGVPDLDKNPIWQQLSNDLNMDMELNVIASEYDQQLNVKMAGGTPPDLFNIGKVPLTEMGRQGLLLDLEPYLDDMPNVKALYDENLLNKGRVDGTLYALPKRADIPMDSLWIRKDWLERLDLEMPTNLETFKEVALAFTNEDPDGNGKADTYGITGTALYTFAPIFGAYGTGGPGSYAIKGGELVYTTEDPAFREALSYIADLIAAGVVDPEIMANKGTDDQQKAFQGKAGILFRGWGELVKDSYVEQYKSINPDAEWVQVGALEGPGDNYMSVWDLGRTPNRLAIPKSLEKSPEKLEQVLELLNYVTGDGKGQNIVNYGIEGTHYKVENGEVVPLPAMSDLDYSWQMQLTARDELAYLSVKFANQKPYIAFAQEQPRLEVYDSFIPVPQGVVADDKTTYETEEITKFIYGRRPLGDYDQFIETLYKQFQLQLYLDSAEDTLTELGYLQ
ncbi:extracellular solute-binding protein [Paenibacillus sp. IB182496]|uniref:Extracellular solute-binding protein n=1 Tax=Paenibacillus sabuli TaxID=2772509 RepID=A0A927GQK0_9BACL|nr:extracellular solute-binding protein [Paenibacillus sabuli]MBD2843975.1 extracellular solute-binding protein [Paenibacillus sabuli]